MKKIIKKPFNFVITLDDEKLLKELIKKYKGSLIKSWNKFYKIKGYVPVKRIY